MLAATAIRIPIYPIFFVRKHLGEKLPDSIDVSPPHKNAIVVQNVPTYC